MADEEIIDTAPEAPVSQAEPVEAPEKAEKPLSLREQIKSNFKAAAEKSPLSDTRPRDESGKFVEKKADAAPTKAAPVETAPKQDAQPSELSKAVGPPPGWSPESKAYFASLPPDHPLKGDIAKREKEVSDGFKKYSDDAKKYQEIEQVLAPARPVYQQNGIRNDAEAIKHLMQWEANIRQNPAAAISKLAQTFNIDLASLAQNPTGPSTGPDPALRQLIQQEVTPLRSELDRILSEKAASEIAQFAKDKPHFESVKMEMGKLIANGSAQDLESAYQRAIWTDPTIRAELMKQEVESKLSSHQQEAMSRSQQARKAAVSPSTRAPAAPMVNGKERSKGVKGSIMAAIDELREGSRA